ncbi:response regulator [Chondromyces apiculatus]|uniref:Response regulatory domain-containing protein n=1 Tax=Chondromyces apiculatus DSM 436 TaxID=1192034 RepID=A0A017T8I8_9BACT|nr:response regulator [Chondromyces apiculatus]EYF05548.1 Hypothetical protein CAP_3096 [Chondromyces apiculatus DSM 436]
MTTRTPTILLLDQDDMLRKMTAVLLSSRGAGAVSPAATLDEAIALAHEAPYDVLLIDRSETMPAARELMDKLRQEGLTPARVVLCTDTPADVDDATDGTEVLLKPYAFDRLVAAVFGRPAPQSEPRVPGRATARVPRRTPTATVGGTSRPRQRASAQKRTERRTSTATPLAVGTRSTARTRRTSGRVVRSPAPPPRVARGRRRPG